MPRTPRNSPNPPGRPRKNPPPTGAPPGRPREVPSDVAAKMARGELAPEDVAAQFNIARSTAFDAMRRAKQEASAQPAEAVAPVAHAAAPTPPTGSQGDGKREQLLAIVCALLDGDPALVERLPLDGAELARRLAEAESVDEAVDLDPLATLARVQRKLEGDLRRLPPDLVAARRAIGAVLVQVAKGAEHIRRGRPTDDGPDEVTRRILAVRERAVERIGVLAGDAAGAFHQRRAEFGEWAEQNLGPMLGAEVLRRVGAMLGEKPAGSEAA